MMPGYSMRSITLFSILTLSSAFQIGQLLSSCIDACEKGCHEIRHVYDNANGDTDALAKLSSLKDVSDPRSVLTQADYASQKVIVQSLEKTWGSELHIVGEEDEIPDDLPTMTNLEDLSSLAKDWLDDDIGETGDIPASEITVFVDPLDGTREFVEGRLENCQVLVGISINGEAVAGAVGLPFGSPDGPTVVYGLVDVGTGVRGAPLTRGPYPLEKYIDGVSFPRPHHAVGDKPVPVIKAALSTVKDHVSGSAVSYGGAGNKILATALGEVSSCLQHKVGGPWDTCASEAVAKAMGAEITDLFGKPIAMYAKDAPSRCNERGFVATAPGTDHEAFMRIVSKCPEVQAYKENVMTTS